MAVNDRTLAQMLAHKQWMGRIHDTRTRQLVAAWVRAWDEVAADLEATILDDMVNPAPSRRLRRARQQEALRLLSRRLLTVCQQAGVAISGDAEDMILAAAVQSAELFATQLPSGARVNWARVDERQVEAIVNRSTQVITARTRELHAEAQQAMRRELMRAVAVGDNPNVAARRMVGAVREKFDGGLTRALVIARTETVDAYRTAAQASQDANADVLVGWQWGCTLSERTCPSCLAHHGELHPLSEPGPLDHHQGRCARIPRAKTWRQLGFDIDEPPSDLEPGDGVAWFEQQPDSVKGQILGPKRMAAYQRGEYGPDKWSVRKSTDGWRDSYHVGPVKG